MSASRVATSGTQRAMSAPDKHYMYDHNAMGDKAAKDGSTSFRSRVAQLKHVFQGEGDMAGNGVPSSPHHATSSGPPPRSPDSVFRKAWTKSSTEPSARREELVDPTIMEPQKYFEVTNHVERFRYTRAIFAQMEEKSRLEQDKGRLFQHKRGHHTGVSNQADRKRASSDGAVLDEVNGDGVHRGGSGALLDSRKYPHVGSVDSISGIHAFERQSKLRAEMSHSESDLSRERSGEVHQQVVSPRASKRVASATVEKSAPKPVPHSRVTGTEHSQPPSYSQHIREKRAAAAAAAAASISQDAAVTNSSRDKRTEQTQHPTHAADVASVASNHSKRDSKPELPPYPIQSVTSSPVTRSNSSPSSPGRHASDRVSQEVTNNDDRPPVVMRRTHVPRENRDAYGMVLLPKRRSRDDARLSNEEIEASLSQADKYWRESGDSATMMDSTHSSGSGEEMARSDSLTHSPTDATATQQAWSAMYALDQVVEQPGGATSWAQQANDRTSKVSRDSNVEEVITLKSPLIPKDEVLEEPSRHHVRSPSPQHLSREIEHLEESPRSPSRSPVKREDDGGRATKTTLEDWITTSGDVMNVDMSSSDVTKEENGTDT